MCMFVLVGNGQSHRNGQQNNSESKPSLRNSTLNNVKCTKEIKKTYTKTVTKQRQDRCYTETRGSRRSCGATNRRQYVRYDRYDRRYSEPCYQPSVLVFVIVVN